MKGKLYENLKESNLFFLSLHSKELFHSNFIAWIAERNKDAFRKFFEDFTGIQLPDKFIVEREKQNFDLCIYVPNNQNRYSISCIIENKVKSMPYAEQLEKYSEKLESMGAKDAKKVLLSLYTKSRPNVDGWVCRTYEDLANSLAKIVPLFEDYAQFLLKDYIEFIKTLHRLQKEKWDIPEKYKAAFTMDDETKELRIDDLCQKIIYSKILNQILEELDEQNYVIGSSLNKLKAYTGEKKVFADCGLSRSIGLLEVKVKVNSGYVLGIQLQGAQYRYLAESLDGEPIHKKCKSDNDIFKFVFNKKVCDPRNQKINSLEKDGEKYPYCKFGDSFMYRYRDVSEANTEDIIEDIVRDCNALIKKIRG